jgi:hypothetical protein
MDPEGMRAAVAEYVTALHRAYLAQADTFPPAVRGAMPLLAGGRLTVAAVGARNLHLLATREALGPLRGQEVSLDGALPGLEWSLRFYDPVVTPALGLLDERDGPAYAEVKHALGVTTTAYHVVAQPGSGLTPHHAGHVGSGLALGRGAGLRDDPLPGPRPRAPGRRAGGGRGGGPPPGPGPAGPGDRPARRGRGGAGRRPGSGPGRGPQGLARLGRRAPRLDAEGAVVRVPRGLGCVIADVEGQGCRIPNPQRAAP